MTGQSELPTALVARDRGRRNIGGQGPADVGGGGGGRDRRATARRHHGGT